VVLATQEEEEEEEVCLMGMVSDACIHTVQINSGSNCQMCDVTQ